MKIARLASFCVCAASLVSGAGFVSSAVAVLIATLVLASSGSATVIPVPEAFFTGLPVTTFDGYTTLIDVNGLTVDGILFNYLVDGIPTSGLLNMDYGPGVTNHVSPPLIVSPRYFEIAQPGTVLLTLPTFADALGYGFAELNALPLSDATTMTLFSGNTEVGSLVYSSSPDPSLTGGFAGIASTVPFNRVTIDFPIAADAFAVDNIVYKTPGVIPEPGTLLLVTSGIGGLLAGRRLSRTL